MFPHRKELPSFWAQMQTPGMKSLGGLTRWLIKSQLTSQFCLDPVQVSCPWPSVRACKGPHVSRGWFSLQIAVQKKLWSTADFSLFFCVFFFSFSHLHTFQLVGILPISYWVSYSIFILINITPHDFLLFYLKLNFHFWQQFLDFLFFLLYNHLMQTLLSSVLHVWLQMISDVKLGHPDLKSPTIQQCLITSPHAI